MTILQWASIAAIRAQSLEQEPYRFIGIELKVAQRMERCGYLKSTGNGIYSVTTKGLKAFINFSYRLSTL